MMTMGLMAAESILCATFATWLMSWNLQSDDEFIAAETAHVNSS